MLKDSSEIKTYLELFDVSDLWGVGKKIYTTKKPSY